MKVNAILTIILVALVAIIAVILVLSSVAHAAALEPHAPDKPLGEGGLEALGIILLVIVVCGLAQHIRRKR